VDELEGTLRQIAAGMDSHFADHAEYPRVFEFKNGFNVESDFVEAVGVSEDALEKWNVIINFGAFGYCVEGDDDQGTWDLARDDAEPARGDCPDD
jgi:hypothetical protein